MDKLKNVQSFFVLKKYSAAKHAIAELFIYIASVNKFIDSELYDAISLFQKLSYNNIKTGLLGRSTCNNTETVSNALNQICEDLILRISEIDKYLNKFSD